MILAFGAIEPLAVAAAALSRGVYVAAAGVVVVLAILLVFVMVLRGAGSSRHKASGLDFDAQKGQFGQPHAPANEPSQAPWAAGQPNGRFDADAQGYDQGYDQGFGQGFGQGRPPAPAQRAQQAAPGWGQPFAEPAQAGGPWSGSPDASADRWEQMTPGAGQMGAGQMGAGQMGAVNDWGAPQSRPAATPWDAPAAQGGAAWNGGAAGPAMPAGRPGAGGNQWDAPAAPSQPSWGAQAPAAPSQPAWSAQAPAPSQPAWGAQAPAPSQPAWGAQAPAPSQPAWGAQADPMMMPTTPRAPQGYGVPHLSEIKPDGAGREFDLRKERLTIGRHRDSDVFLEDLAVSRLHTTISQERNGGFILRDENSANGTYVNGQRVQSDVALKDGDEVQVGQTVLVFHQR